MAVHVVDTLTKVVCYAAGVVEGLVVGLWTGRPVEPVGGPLPVLGADEPLDEVRAALLGRSRRFIAKALGAPPTASVGFGSVAAPGRKRKGKAPMTFWQATTWYYPFDAQRRQAIAIRFEANRARQVDFIGSEA
jgi:hypothetical protein